MASPAAGRSWDDLTVLGIEILLGFCRRRNECPTHARVQRHIPWVDRYARITCRLEWRICVFCRAVPQTATGEILLMPRSTLSGLLHHIIGARFGGYRIRFLRSLGDDEVSYCKGPEFATLVYDLDRARSL